MASVFSNATSSTCVRSGFFDITLQQQNIINQIMVQKKEIRRII